MHATRNTEKSMVIRIATIAVLWSGAVAAGAAGRGQAEEAVSLAKAALMPYRTAHAYRGARTTTFVFGKEENRLTMTTAIQARADDRGAITRLRAQTTSWGDAKSKEIAGTEDRLLTYDGKTVWIYYPDTGRYRRDVRKPSDLPTLLGLPPVEAAWTFAPRTREDEPGERAVRASIEGEEWTLALDSTGHLHRLVRVSGKGAGRIVATTTLRDLAFDTAADLPDERYAFHPPVGATEDRTIVAQEGRPLLP